MIPNFHVVECIKPQTGGSARSGDWISLKDYNHATIIVHIAMGNAATTAITVDKGKTAAGGSNSDGITVNWAFKATGQGTTDTYTQVTGAASFTSSATGSGSEIYRLDIDGDELGDDYDYFQLELGASNASNLVSAVAILSGPRFGGDPDAQLTAIA